MFDILEIAMSLTLERVVVNIWTIFIILTWILYMISHGIWSELSKLAIISCHGKRCEDMMSNMSNPSIYTTKILNHMRQDDSTSLSQQNLQKHRKEYSKRMNECISTSSDDSSMYSQGSKQRRQDTERLRSEEYWNEMHYKEKGDMIREFSSMRSGRRGSESTGRSNPSNQRPSKQSNTIQRSYFLSFYDYFLDWQVEKSLFTYMYIVGIVCGSIAILFEIFAADRSSIPYKQSCNFIVLSMFLIQVLRRYYECLHITIYGKSKMHLAGFLVGALHYVLVPLTIYASNSLDMMTISYGETIDFVLSKYHPAIMFTAIYIFAAANYWQFIHHRVLYRMKLDSMTQITNNQRPIYNIPEGYLFEYVCCPHYTMEILIYLSIFMTSLNSFALFVMLLWVISNLSVVSEQQYDWYRHRYPEAFEYRFKQMKRLIPFIW